jgi:hypothetical protein
MKIHWGRVVIAGFLAEILLIAVYLVVSQPLTSLVGATIGLGGGFVFMLLAALWAAQKIESRFVLHGILVGISAIVFYTIGDVLRGQLHLAGHSVFFYIAHITKILGGAAGGYIAGRRKANAV